MASKKETREELGEGSRTEASAADELSCSPSTVVSCSFSDFASAIGESTSSSANLLAASPLGAVVGVWGVLGEERGAVLVCGRISIKYVEVGRGGPLLLLARRL